ncbi:MAG: CaiB/BaiF CoA-transferase family protein [Dehalococcoidia bacterium]|nr:CaiB/BaiF CoA-transferase family protein [Dehalococcoidia bacterium]
MKPLDGILVLDLARGYPGAYTTMFLGDFGAEVIRIDPPRRGMPLADIATREAAFNTVNRNKKSMVIDLQTPDGQKVLHRLAQKADVLLEGFRPGVMKRLNAGYETLEGINPRLVYCSLSGFGQTGPYAHLPGHDMNYVAIGGLLSQIGPKDGAPCFASNWLADMAGAGLHGVIGILLALRARDATGKGQYIDIAYLDAAVSLLAYDTARYFGTGLVPKRGETSFTGAVPWTHVYRCKDGEYITVAAIESHLYGNLCRALGREDLVDKQRTTPEENERIKGIFAEIFLTRTRDEWWEYLKGKDTCAGPVNYLDETFADPQVQHRQMVVEVPHPELGAVKQLGLAIKLGDTPGGITRLGVPAGTDSKSILNELGYSDVEIEDLLTRKIIGEPSV